MPLSDPQSSSFPLHHLAYAALLVFLCAPVLRAQSSTDPAPTPSAPPSAQQTLTPDSPSKPVPPSKPKHVITNEDLEPRSSRNSNSSEAKLPGEDTLLQCNTTCETQAREYLGYDSDNEAEWRVQIVKARPELAEDTVWRGMLSQAKQQANTYCNLLLQQSQKTAPSGNDYHSQVQQSRNAQYFENMERTLRQGMQATVNRMRERIKEVQVLSPVRAAMMYVQAARIFERTCDPPGAR